MIETTISRGNRQYAQHPSMLSTYGWTGELHAFEAHAIVSSKLFEDCRSKCKYGTVRLGRARRSYGECTKPSTLQINMANPTTYRLSS